jgi:hypothetical protein
MLHQFLLQGAAGLVEEAAIDGLVGHPPADIRVARALRRGREAFGHALWLADYCRADQ